ncbi:hypothetical protein MMC17_000132 [Xylographa soralifera]|nr:hypothetical protein [Xylographa soralifera]
MQSDKGGSECKSIHSIDKDQQTSLEIRASKTPKRHCTISSTDGPEALPIEHSENTQIGPQLVFGDEEKEVGSGLSDIDGPQVIPLEHQDGKDTGLQPIGQEDKELAIDSLLTHGVPAGGKRLFRRIIALILVTVIAVVIVVVPIFVIKGHNSAGSSMSTSMNTSTTTGTAAFTATSSTSNATISNSPEASAMPGTADLWKPGNLGSYQFRAPLTRGVGMSVMATNGSSYFVEMSNAPNLTVAGVLRLYVGGIDGLVHEYNYYSQNDTWNTGYVFPGTNGYSGILIAVTGTRWSLYTFNDAGVLLGWFPCNGGGPCQFASGETPEPWEEGTLLD